MQVAQLAVQLAAPLPCDVTFDYATANSTATAGSDYVATSGRATIPAGSIGTTIPVCVLGDVSSEVDEAFYVNLSNPAGAILADDRVVASIVDADPLPSVTIQDVVITEGKSGIKNAKFTLALSAPSGRTVSVNYATADGTATAVSDYVAKSGIVTWYAGTQTQTVYVPLVADAIAEPDEVFFLDLSNPVNAVLADDHGAATIINDDPAPVLSIADAKALEGNSGTKTFTFTVTLSAASTQTVTVQYATADGTAAAGSDYDAKSGVLSFAPGLVSKSITVTVRGDVASEPDETFLVELSSPANAVLLTAQGIGTILNDDNRLAVSDAEVVENDNGAIVAATFWVSLPTAVGHEVCVEYATANGTATAGSDYLPANGTLRFSPGETSKPVSVPVFGDRLNEAHETFLLKLANPVGAQLADSQATGTIQDDDPLPRISVADVAIAEGDSGTKSLSFVLTLSVPSGRSVSVNYATADVTATAGSDYVAKSGTATFAAGTTSQTVSITVNGDAAAEINETLVLQPHRSCRRRAGQRPGRGHDPGRRLLDDRRRTDTGRRQRRGRAGLHGQSGHPAAVRGASGLCHV